MGKKLHTSKPIQKQTVKLGELTFTPDPNTVTSTKNKNSTNALNALRAAVKAGIFGHEQQLARR